MVHMKEHFKLCNFKTIKKHQENDLNGFLMTNISNSTTVKVVEIVKYISNDFNRFFVTKTKGFHVQ